MARDGGPAGADQDGAAGVPRHPQLGRRLLLLNLLMLLLVVALVLLAQAASRRNFVDRARVATENLSATLAQSIESEIDVVDIVLRTLAIDLESEYALQSPDAGRIDALLAQQTALLPGLDSVRIADAQGIVRRGPGVAAAGRIDISDRDYFVQARSAQRRGPVISEPLLGRVSRKWVVVIARPLYGPDGRFAGIVFATVAVERFQQLIGSVNLGRQGAVTVRSVGNTLVARRTAGGELPTAIGTSNVSAALSEALRSAPSDGTFVARTALDGVERVNAYRRAGKHPLLVLVGLATDDFLDAWHIETLQVAALASLVMLTLAASSGLLYRAWSREARSSQALIREGQRHRALLRAAGDGMHVLDRAGHLVEMSDSFAAMLGYRREELLTRHMSFWAPEMSVEQVDRRMRAFGIGSLVRVSDRHRRSDGCVVDVEIICLGVRVDGEELLYCSSRDVTERLAQARELEQHRHHLEELVAVRTGQWRASEVRFRALVEQSLVGVYVQVRNRYGFVNPAFAQIFGFDTPEQIIGQVPAHTLIAPEDLERVNDISRRVVGGDDRITKVSFTGLRRDGTRVAIETYACPIHDDDGPAAIGLLLDVSAQRQAEAERGAALVREQGLRSAAEQQARSLRELLEQREEFVRVLAHEVRQPLNNASAALQSAAAGVAVDAAGAAQRIARAQSVIGQIVASLDNTLAAAMLLSSGRQLDGRDADVGTLIDLSLGDLPVASRPRVHVQRSSSTRTATMDIGLMRLALRNVLGNALHYSPAGSEVVLRVVDSDDPLALVFEVSDRGPGIAGELLPRLFERGARGSHGLPGHGIGLHVVQRVMQLHGGQVDLQPNRPHGTTFRLWLPQGR